MTNKLFTAILVTITLVISGLIIFDSAQATPSTPTETTSTTTSTTTIDLSWLNTTTTTAVQPVQTVKVNDFFECIRHRESRGDYTAVNPTGTFMGAYQIYQEGWDTFAARINRHDLVGIPPNTVAPADQDAVALAMYNELGKKPWGGAC
ncbi:MAG: hypothetical protein F2801_04615 [Actinobacteria bacterium]|nr:hypothetical protein [Actinomycetota bacterium]